MSIQPSEFPECDDFGGKVDPISAAEPPPNKSLISFGRYLEERPGAVYIDTPGCEC